MALTRLEQEAQLTQWLNNVDSMISVAMHRKNAAILQEYFERNCLLEQLDFIMHSKPETKGIERYKVVHWSRRSAKQGVLTYRKSVEYQNINFSKYVKAKVGDNYIEDWSVRKVDGKIQVTNIVRYDAWERDL